MSRTIRSTALDATLLHVGLGAMSLSFPGVTEEQAFETLKYAMSLVKDGEKLVINSSEHYGAGGNLKLLSKFFTENPELNDRALIVVKGALGIFNPDSTGMPVPDASADALRLSAEGCARLLHPHRVDVFEFGRIDRNVPLEDALKTLLVLQKEGLFDHIGLSECSAATLLRASAVAPITTVEIEVSPIAWEDETKKVLSTAAETGSVILAYSPMGRGLITAKKYDDLNPMVRKMFPRFSEENYAHNKHLGEKITAIAEKGGLTPAQVSVSWVKNLGEAFGGTLIVPIPGTSKVARAKENLAALDVDLSTEDQKAVTEIAESAGIQGDRYPSQQNAWVWG